MYVVDVQTNKLVKAIPGVPGVTGLEYVQGLRKVYTSDWGEERIGVVSLKSFEVIKRLVAAAKPNGSTYAAGFHKVYVSDTLGKAVAVIDVDRDEVVKTLLRNTNEVAEIDPATDTVLGMYPVEGCRYNHGMAICRHTIEGPASRRARGSARAPATAVYISAAHTRYPPPRLTG